MSADLSPEDRELIADMRLAMDVMASALGTQIHTIRRVDGGAALDNGHAPDCPFAWPEDAKPTFSLGPRPQPCPADHEEVSAADFAGLVADYDQMLAHDRDAMPRKPGRGGLAKAMTRLDWKNAVLPHAADIVNSSHHGGNDSFSLPPWER